MLCSYAKCFIIHSIISFKNAPLIPESSSPSWRLLSASNLTAILISKMKYPRQPLSKENKMELKHKSSRFSSFSLPNPWLQYFLHGIDWSIRVYSKLPKSLKLKTLNLSTVLWRTVNTDGCMNFNKNFRHWKPGMQVTGRSVKNVVDTESAKQKENSLYTSSVSSA